MCFLGIEPLLSPFFIGQGGLVRFSYGLTSTSQLFQNLIEECSITDTILKESVYNKGKYHPIIIIERG